MRWYRSSSIIHEFVDLTCMHGCTDALIQCLMVRSIYGGSRARQSGNKEAMEQNSEEVRKQTNRQARNQNVRVCTHRSSDG